MFSQPGLPRQVAEQDSPLLRRPHQRPVADVDGLRRPADHATGPAAASRSPATRSSRFTTAQPGDYFDNGVDPAPLARDPGPASSSTSGRRGGRGEDETYLERVQYMFRVRPAAVLAAAPISSPTAAAPAFLPERFPGHPRRGAERGGHRHTGRRAQHRIGHLSALQRSSRARRTARRIHIRMDGPGFDILDVPDGSERSRSCSSSVFVPTADFFRTMRRNQASLDLQAQFQWPRRQRAGAVPHLDPAAELPLPAAAAPGLPAGGADLTA